MNRYTKKPKVVPVPSGGTVRLNERVRMRLATLLKAAQDSAPFQAYNAALAIALESIGLDPAAQVNINLETGEVSIPNLVPVPMPVSQQNGHEPVESAETEGE